MTKKVAYSIIAIAIINLLFIDAYLIEVNLFLSIISLFVSVAAIIYATIEGELFYE